jgi:hypothetical protein
MQPDLLDEVSGDDRGKPLVTGSNGPLMARTRGAGFSPRWCREDPAASA